jgi:hypothetical protein
MSAALDSTHLLPPNLARNLPARDTCSYYFTIPVTVKQILHSLVWQQRVTSTDEKTLKHQPTKALRTAASLILAHRVSITDRSTTPCQLNTLFIMEIFQKIIVFSDIERTAHKKGHHLCYTVPTFAWRS